MRPTVLLAIIAIWEAALSGAFLGRGDIVPGACIALLALANFAAYVEEVW
jgi:hypothetical protein